MRKSGMALALIAVTAIIVSALGAAPRPEPVVVRSALIQTGDLVQTIPLMCTVQYDHKQVLVSPRSGRVAKVYAREGQRVRRGDLLFYMDISAEEQALSSLFQLRYQRQQTMKQTADAVATLAAQSEINWLQKENELKTLISLSQIRSEADGIVEFVYVADNALAETGMMLGTVRGEEKCIVAEAASDQIADVENQSMCMLHKNGQAVGTALLQKISAPLHTALGSVQQLTLRPAQVQLLEGLKAGETLEGELITGVMHDRALIPLEAVDSTECVWVIENEKAIAVRVDIRQRNHQFIAVSADEWAGRRVILRPDENQLTSGCSVQEAKHI